MGGMPYKPVGLIGHTTVAAQGDRPVYMPKISLHALASTQWLWLARPCNEDRQVHQVTPKFGQLTCQ